MRSRVDLQFPENRRGLILKLGATEGKLKRYGVTLQVYPDFYSPSIRREVGEVADSSI